MNVTTSLGKEACPDLELENGPPGKAEVEAEWRLFSPQEEDKEVPRAPMTIA